MLIIWRGWGFIVPLSLLLGFFVGTGVGSLLYHGADTSILDAIIFSLGGVIAGAIIWIVAAKLEARPGRVFIDKATGREINVGASAGSCFFIPTRYWAYISVGLGAVAAIAHLLRP